MPTRLTPNQFPAVTGTVVFLAFVGAVSYNLRGRAPATDTNSFAQRKEDYLASGGHVDIDWKVPSLENFAEAAKGDKPIMLVSGNKANRAARVMDSAIFSNPDVSDFINQHFYPMRIDAIVRPDISRSLLPLVRAEDYGNEFDPGFQVWFFTPDAAEYYQYSRRRPARTVSAVEFLAALDQADRRFHSIGSVKEEVPGVQQEHEVTRLSQVSELASLDHPRTLSTWITTASPQLGGWPSPYGIRLYAAPFRYLVKAGLVREAELILAPMLASSMVDWVDGGFYQISGIGFEPIELDKFAVANADMATLCAELYCLTGDPRYKRIATDTFDFLANRLVSPLGHVLPYEIGDEVEPNRSARASITPRFIGEKLSPAGTARAALFSLNPAINGPMLIRVPVSKPFAEIQPELDTFLAEVRPKLKPSKRELASTELCDTAATSVARLLNIARLLKDRERIKKADDLFFQLDWFVSSDYSEITRAPSLGEESPPTIATDYLAFADACFEHFLISGNEFALVDGAKLLRRLVDRFAISDGILSLTEPREGKELFDGSVTPDIADSISISNTAYAIQVFSRYRHYFRLVRNDPSVGGYMTLISEFLATSVPHFSAVASRLKVRVAGFHLAALEAEMDTCILVAGDDCRERALEITPSFPTTSVIPLAGRAAKSGPKAAGFYWMERGEISGPHSVSDLKSKAALARKRVAGP